MLTIKEYATVNGMDVENKLIEDYPYGLTRDYTYYVQALIYEERNR